MNQMATLIAVVAVQLAVGQSKKGPRGKLMGLLDVKVLVHEGKPQQEGNL